MTQVTGIGGVFLRARDADALRRWYADHLGIPVDSDSGAPFMASGSYSEALPTGGTCTRTLSDPLPIERLILAVVNCHRGVEEPSSGLVLRCDDPPRLRVRGLSWTGWNKDVAVGRGKLHGRAVRVVLSHPVECSELNGFIYSRASVSGVARRIPIYCPLPD